MATEVLPGTQTPLQAPKASTDGESGGPPRPEVGNSQGSPQPTEKTTEPEQPPQQVKQSEVVEGGNPNLEIWLDPTTQKLAAERLINRLQVAKALAGKERPLTFVDRAIQRLSPEAIARLEKGDLVRKDLMLTVFVLRDELLQKSLAAGQLVKDNKIVERRKVGIPLFKRIVENSRLQTQLETSAQKLSTEYTREIGFDQWTSDRIENDLVTLNQLRTSVDLSFYGRHLDDPLFDQDSISLYTAGRKTGNRLHDAVVDELIGIEGILTQRFGGKTLLELSQEDPIAATQALFEANQRALTSFAGELAINLLKSEVPKAEADLIEQQAQKLETKPTPEDLTKLQEAATKASTEFTDVETRLNTLNAPVEAAENILTEKQLAYNKAKENFGQISTRLNPEIQRLEERVELLYNNIQEPDPSLSPEQKADLQRTVATTTQNIVKIETTLQSYRDKLNQLLQTQIDSQLDMEEQERSVAKLKNKRTAKGLDDAQKEFDQKKAAKENAEKALKEKQKAGEAEVSPEAKEKAKALRKWNEVVGGYDKIVNARFSQKYTDDYARERLADIEETSDGEIKGAERIREHIFRLVNEGGYAPILARKMLSDETIARAIIWNYKLDTQRPIDSADNLATLLWKLQLRKDTLLTTSNTLTETPASQTKKRADLEKGILQNKLEIHNAKKQLIRSVLPYLRSSQFQVGDLLRFMIHEGVKSAERGNPYLALDKYFETPEPELRLEAESIYREGVGEVKRMEDNEMVWEGTVANPIIPNGFAHINPLYCSAGFKFSPDRVDYNLYVKVDRGFLESLPAEINDLLPEEVKSFYDESGKLRTDRPITRIKLYESLADAPPNTTDEALDALDHQISNELSQGLAASVGDYFLKKSQTERLQILSGFHTVSVTGVGLTENPTELHNYQISLDKAGNFFIQDITDPASTKEYELAHFFQKRLKDFKGTKFSLSQDERKTQQEEFIKILDPLGREILRAQQRR